MGSRDPKRRHRDQVSGRVAALCFGEAVYAKDFAEATRRCYRSLVPGVESEQTSA